MYTNLAKHAYLDINYIYIHKSDERPNSAHAWHGEMYIICLIPRPNTESQQYWHHYICSSVCLWCGRTSWLSSPTMMMWTTKSRVTNLLMRRTRHGSFRRAAMMAIARTSFSHVTRDFCQLSAVIWCVRSMERAICAKPFFFWVVWCDAKRTRMCVWSGDVRVTNAQTAPSTV